MDYSLLTDEQIAVKAQEGSGDAVDFLLEKYKNFVRSKARTYFLMGADHEDIVQEGMIGLYKAIRDYRAERHSSFRAFADLCITRQIITAIRTATRQKHIPLNSYVPLDKPIFEDGNERTLMEVVKEDAGTNPESVMISGEELDAIHDKLDSMLSVLEMKSLYGYVEGKSYQEISEKTGYRTKAIDNALQRVKKKLLKYLAERDK